MAAQKTSNHYAGRRWRQFSLRSLLVVMFVSAIFSATVGARMKTARQQQRAVRLVAERGGLVNYDFNDVRAATPDALYTRQHSLAPPNTYRQLRKILGDDFFDTVVEVRVGDPDPANDWQIMFADDTVTAAEAVNDRFVEALVPLTRLKRIYLPLGSFSDTSVSLLCGHEELEDVCLRSPNLTDDAVACLAKLPKVMYLALSSPRITDAALASIEEMGNLKELDLRKTSVTREGMNRLHGKLPKTWMRYSWPAR
jgi:hypothetical protein